jgi:TolB-like protein/DNA-binding winged helix-turn-helix (wHTH) protein/Tfp pilus assembly protein PilF
MDVLIHLAANRGRVVSKEELLTVVWGGAFVEEGALAQAIHSLRKALGDDARQSRFIQTVPKRGYRLVAEGVAEVSTGTHSSPTFSTTAVEVQPSTKPSLWRVLSVSAGLVLVAMIIWLLLDRLGGSPDGRTTIVVIPFENLGRPEDAFFADGLTEEITKDLASLHALRVTSRTSALLYRRGGKSVREIARELGVEYVLEGTVRWEKGTEGRPRVRVTPQLIHAVDDIHVWANAYSLEVRDVFEVQEEISQKVIEALGIKLIPGETRKPSPRSQNLDAYRAYLRGLQLKNQPFYSGEYLEKAASMFQRAVELDPGFADAWAELSQVHSYLAFNNDGSPSEAKEARLALEKATSLAPDSPDVRVAQAYFSYRCLGDFDAALEQLSAAAELFPNDAGVLQSLGLVLRRKGRFRDAVQALRSASELNPRSSETLWAIGETYRALRDFQRADEYYRQAISLAPDEAYFWEELTLNQLAWTGDVRKARAILQQAPVQGVPRLKGTAFKLDIYERKYRQALARLSPQEIRQLPAPEPDRIAMLSVLARERLGDRQGALKAAAANSSELRARLAVFPKEALSHAYLAVALAQLGRKAEALAEADRSIQIEKQDAFAGPQLVQIAAMVETILGHRREPLNRLSELLSSSYRSAISSQELRLDPVWDPLRGDPELAALSR